VSRRKVLTFLGTRPEIIKLSPVLPLLDARAAHTVVHSGQHYSFEMDAQFFQELGLRTPDHAIAVGSASHGEQTARMLARLEPIILDITPDVVLVQGDTNSTLAGGLCAAKLGVPVVHLESGARSFDRFMPEELNRIVVDHLSAVLLAADEIAQRNVLREGIAAERVHVIGSTAIDAVEQVRDRAAAAGIVDRLGLTRGRYVVVTAHRAGNTTPEILPGLLQALGAIAEQQPVVFPLHPRTKAAMTAQGLTMPAAITVTEPLGYLDTLKLVGDAKALLTDSGGLQEESGVLGTPTLILRFETEWQYLVDAGAHKLIGNTPASIRDGAARWLADDGLGAIRATPIPIVRGAAARAVDLILRAH
jgi:UDP-N-acetylglucosamine 2-epimerase (non-hydrolysing)